MQASSNGGWWSRHAMPLVLSVCACNGPGIGSDVGEPFCGDGVKASDELCDDGNQTAGDGCSADCVPSGTQLECVPLLEGHWRNQANALLAMPDHSFIVAGVSTIGLETYGWIAHYSDSGELRWFEQLSSTDGHGSVDALTPDGQDGAWALVWNSASPELRHFSRDGLEDETIDISQAFGAPVSPYTIEFVEGSVWIGGTRESDSWLGRYDSSTEVASTLMLEDHLGFNDEIRAIGRAADEVVAAAATVSTSPNNMGDLLLLATTDIVLIRFDLAGNEIGRVLLASDPGKDFSPIAEDIVSAGPGRWLVGGDFASLGFTPSAGAWLRQSGPSADWAWDSLTDDAIATYGGIVAYEDAVGLAFGDYGSDAVHGEGGVIGFTSNGEVGWRQSNTYDGYDHYEEQQITVEGPARLRTVGKAWTEDVGSQLQSCIIAR